MDEEMKAKFSWKRLKRDPILKRRAIWISLIVLIVVMVIAVTLGNYKIPIRDVFEVIGCKFTGKEISEIRNGIIVWEVRMPRIILSAFAGMALAMSGAVFQGVFKNPLVEPYILGVSSGAAFGAGLSIVYFSGRFSISFLAFIFAVIAMLLSYKVATKDGSTPLINLILAGIVVSSLFGAMLNLIKIVSSSEKLREIAFWLMGGFYVAKWEDVILLIPLVSICLLILRICAWKLNVLTMGEQEASALGVNVDLLKFIALGTATLATSTTVSLAGIISWVGLMIPHASRLIIGSDHRYLIPFSAITGGIFMVLCDTVARCIIFGELPISIVTSLIGAPYVIYLLRKNRMVSFG